MSPRLIEATNYDLFVLVLWQITVIVEYDDRSSWGACWATDDDKPVYQSVWGRCSAVFYKQAFELQKRHVFIKPICGWSIQIGVQFNVFEKPILALGRLDWAWPQSPAAESLELIVVDSLYCVNLYWTHFPSSRTSFTLTLSSYSLFCWCPIFFRRSFIWHCSYTMVSAR